MIDLVIRKILIIEIKILLLKQISNLSVLLVSFFLLTEVATLWVLTKKKKWSHTFPKLRGSGENSSVSIFQAFKSD